MKKGPFDIGGSTNWCSSCGVKRSQGMLASSQRLFLLVCGFLFSVRGHKDEPK